MTPRTLLLSCGLAGMLLTAALLTDQWIWRHVRWVSVYEHDWGRLLRVSGSLFFWLPLTLALWLERSLTRNEAAARIWLVLLAPLTAGLVAELLKLLVRRERPALHAGAYFYRGFQDRPFATHDIGFPSSHVMVAFAGAAALSHWYPRAGWVAYALASGCAVTRLLAQAHFASDVVAAAIGGWAVATWLLYLTRPRLHPA